MMLYRSSGLSTSPLYLGRELDIMVSQSFTVLFIHVIAVFSFFVLVPPVLVQFCALSFLLISVHVSKGAARFVPVFSISFLRGSIYHLDHHSLVIYSTPSLVFTFSIAITAVMITRIISSKRRLLLTTRCLHRIGKVDPRLAETCLSLLDMSSATSWKWL